MTTLPINGIERRLNWRRQPTDLRDLAAGPIKFTVAPLPMKATTRTKAEPAVRDQGQAGSCSSNAGAEAMAFVYMAATGKPDPMFSRLFGYWMTRVKIEGSPPTEDSGCNVRDVFKAYRRFGMCYETTWPYDIGQLATEPSDIAKMEALRHQAIRYYSCATLRSIQRSIVDGYPVIFGFDCFESLDNAETARTGLIPLPKLGEASIGGHCMYIDSYDSGTREVSGINSWGTDWGDRGRFRLPYGYFSAGYASDGMTLRTEEIE